MSSWHQFVSGRNPVEVTDRGTAVVTYDKPWPKYADMGAYSESRFQAAEALGVSHNKLLAVDVTLDQTEYYTRVSSIEFGVKR